MDESLLDTDILTEIFKLRNQTVAANAAAYLAGDWQHNPLSMDQRFVARRLA